MIIENYSMRVRNVENNKAAENNAAVPSTIDISSGLGEVNSESKVRHVTDSPPSTELSKD